MYLYRHTIYRDTEHVIGLSAEQITDNDTDKADFESNHLGFCQMVDDIVIAETSFMSELSYADFKALLQTPPVWSDVKCIDNGHSYTLHVVSETEL